MALTMAQRRAVTRELAKRYRAPGWREKRKILHRALKQVWELFGGMSCRAANGGQEAGMGLSGGAPGVPSGGHVGADHGP